MSPGFFVDQINRLRTRFGQKTFDQEFVKLVAREVDTMSDHGFSRFVDVMIGSRTHLKPPLLSEFREARLSEEKLKFQNDVRGAVSFMDRKAPVEMRSKLRAILSREYGGGVESVKDAMQVARLRMLKGDDEKGPA